MIHIDLETYSLDTLKNGVHFYAEHSSTRILICVIIDDVGRTFRWTRFDDYGENAATVERMKLAVANNETCAAHNASFEHALLRQRAWSDMACPAPEVDQWYCTAVQCRVNAVPHALATAAKFLKTEAQKDTGGWALMNLFSFGHKTKGTFATKKTNERARNVSGLLDPHAMELAEPEVCVTVTGLGKVGIMDAWARYISYCVDDVRAEMAIHEKLPVKVNAQVLRGFHLDMRMNDRGIPLNVPALLNAEKILEQASVTMIDECIALCGYKPSQTGKLLAWLVDHGYKGESLTAGAMEDETLREGMTSSALRVLDIRQKLSFAATKKIGSMLSAACIDNRLRSQFFYYGAHTGRWSSRGVQIQNVKRPTISDHASAYATVRQVADAEIFELIHGDVVEGVASTVRNYLQPFDGRVFLDYDYSNIEGRVAAWVCGNEEKLQQYRDGVDLYKVLASAVFDKPAEEITGEERFVGKVGELSLQYQSGPEKFWATCASWGQAIEKELAVTTVKAYRETNPEMCALWASLHRAACRAVRKPGTVFAATDNVYFIRKRNGFDRLCMVLPSGRAIVFPEATVYTKTVKHRNFITGEVSEFETDSLTYYGPIPMSSRWGRVATYGGSLANNLIQGIAFDIMLHGMLKAEKAGFELVATIHDQALADEPDAERAELFRLCLTNHPEWLPESFPLEADGGAVPYYSKG